MPQVATQVLSMNVTPVAPLAISTTALPDAVEFQPYSQQLVATGGTGPYTWTATGGTFPPGITLSSSGLLSGVPTASGAFSFTVQVTDSGA
jgi:Putative Ig domain